jgi:hypothetical protein
LLPQDAAYEPPAADEPACFATAESAEDVSPGNGEALSLTEPSKDDPVASQELFGDVVRQKVVVHE